MGRSAGGVNRQTFKTLCEYYDLSESHGDSLEALYICGMTGLLPGRGRRKVTMSEQLGALREVTGYGYSKLATLQVVAPEYDGPLQISFDMFGDLDADPSIVDLVELADSELPDE